MQPLIALLTQLSSKAWVVIVVTVVSGSAATVFYFSSANAGSTPPVGNPPVVVLQTGPVTLPNCGSPLPVVPEANAGLVLIPIVAAMLLLSSRRLWPAKACQASIGQKTGIEP
jgi:hypothetical protein